MSLVSAINAVRLFSEPLSLSEAYESALKNNHGYQSTVYQSQSFEKVMEQQNARLYPQVQLSLNGGLHDYIQNIDPYPSASEIYKSYSLSLTQPLYHPEFLAQADQGELRYFGAKTESFKASQQLGIDVVKNYFEWIIAGQSLLLSRENYLFYEIKYKQIDRMLAEGLSNKMDLLDTKIYLDRAAIDMKTAEKKERLARLRLEQLIGRTIDSAPKLKVYPDLTGMINIIYPASIDDVPDVQLAKFQRRIAEEELNIRGYEHYPKVDLSLSRSENDTDDRTMVKQDNRAFIQISVPIYSGGYASAHIAEAEVLRHAAVEKERQAELDSRYHLEELTEQMDLSVQNYVLLNSALDSARLNLVAVEKAKMAGLKSQVDLLEGQSKVNKIQQDRLRQLKDFLTTTSEYYAFTGKLDTDTMKKFDIFCFDR